MKKLHTTNKYRVINKKRATNRLRRQVAFKERKKRVNRAHSHHQRQSRVTKEAKTTYTTVTAPELFSFITNTAKVNLFIQQLEVLLENKIPVFVSLEPVKFIDYAAITALLSIMLTFKAAGVKFNGDLPTDYLARRRVGHSGFLNRLFNVKLDGGY